jgi:adenine deaminase
MILKANLVDIENRKITPSIIEIEDSYIKSIKETDEKFDTFILNGFIDSHIHIESSMLIPTEFSRLAVAHGSVATVSDPHEIANVLGIDGVKFMIENSKKTPFKFYFGASPCVPATPFETSGAVLGVEEIEELLKIDEIKYLSEVMNFPGVINNDEDMLSKINLAKKYNKKIDGHSPALSGDELSKYINAGISTDHEAFSYEEAKEKILKGMKIQIREGSAAKNYEALSPLIKEYPEKLMFCSDDRHPNDLVKEHINSLVVRSVQKGYDVFDVLKIACLNPINHYGLDVGGLRVGDKADFIEVKDLEKFEVLKTVIDGEIVFDGESKIKSVESEALNIFNAKEKSVEEFEFISDFQEIEVIEAIDGELVTKEKIFKTNSKNFQSDQKNDILKLSVINRYKNSSPSISFITGFGIKNGAIASSVAHDSHNIVAVGSSDELITKAVNLVIKNRGAVVAVNENEEKVLSLNVAGIMSNGDGFEVAKKYDEIDKFSKEILKSTLHAPFMTLSFMALLVIPEIKLSDKGLFDGREFHFIKPVKV